ncbi:FtsK/SpoIIIE-like protein [Bacillus phage FI_KG-Lek]|nr:FtsK/SpoIIIE-like protein [Bacillus phage FI_KG-Lek]
MKKEQQRLLGACQQMLSHIARIGGALGFRLIFCTQYPTGDTLPRQVKQNSDAKLGFRLPTQTASSVVIDEAGLETIKSIPGRAIFKTDRLTEIQVPYISNEMMWEHLKDMRWRNMRMQTHMQINRQMAILATIRKLQFATRRHLMSIHEMGGIKMQIEF